MKNYKQGLPSFPSASGNVLSSTSFLIGELKTYYGPGQFPDAGEVPYSPPSDWPAAGTPLYMPQVVWLVVDMPWPFIPDGTTPFGTAFPGAQFNAWDFSAGYKGYGYQGTIDSLSGVITVVAAEGIPGLGTPDPLGFPLGAWGPPVPIGGGLNQYTATSGTISGGYGAYTASIPNPYRIERNRLLNLFSELATNLFVLRSNRTWFVGIDPWKPQLAHPILYEAQYFPGMPRLYWPMMSPSDQGDYLGTNWLVIYCGCPATTEKILQDPTNSTDLMAMDTGRSNSLPLIRAANSNFFGLSWRFFDLSLDVGTFPPVPSQTAVIPTPTTFRLAFGDIPADDPYVCVTGGGGGHYCLTFWNQLYTTSALQAIVNGLIASENASVTGFNTFNHSVQSQDNTIIASDVLALQSNGIDARRVDSTSVITADYLVNLIAGHFNFDPSTGKDLG